jgi:hypothetical protein
VTRYSAFLLALPLVISAGMSAAPPAAQSVPSETIGSLVLFCSLDRPVVKPDGAIKASVVADSPDQAKIAYRWTATEGAFVAAGQEPSSQASGSEVQWTAKGASPGSHKLLLAARDSAGSTGSCSLTVVVSAGDRGSETSSIRDLARAFLARDALEAIGYGLYSYLIFPDECVSSQSGSARERCNIFVRQALVQIQAEKDMKNTGAALSSHLNITYLLVKHAVPSDITARLDRHLDDQVSWILTNYDYARCHKLLLLLKDSVTRPGPIVISTRDPIFRTNAHATGKPPEKAPEQLFQDYSDVPLNILPLWFRRFQNQCFQEQFWQPNALDTFSWGLRKYLAIAGLGLPLAQASVKTIGPN